MLSLNECGGSVAPWHRTRVVVILLDDAWNSLGSTLVNLQYFDQ